MRRTRPVRAAAAIVVTATALAACGSSEEPDAAEGPAVAADGDVCAAAEDEDAMEAQLNFGNPDPIVDAFSEAYPEVDIEVLTLRPEDSVQRLVTELASGKQPSIDVIYGGLPSLAPMVSREYVDSEIDWEAAGVDPELVSAANTVRVAQVAYGVGFNTEKYSEDDLPDTWEGFIDKEWDGKLLLDPRGRPFSFLSVEWGEDEAVDFVTRLKKEANPIVFQGTTAGLLAIASGEGDILLNSKTAETEEQVKAGAPLGIKLMEIVPTEGTQLGILKGSEQPNAAQCFVSWAASSDGADAIFEAELKKNELPELPEGSQYVEIETEEELEIADATIERLSEIIGEPVNPEDG